MLDSITMLRAAIMFLLIPAAFFFAKCALILVLAALLYP